MPSDDMAPALDRVFAIEAGCVSIMPRAPVRDESALSHDEASATLRAATIISRDIFAGDAIGRHSPGHGRHGNSVLEGQVANANRLKERLETASARARWRIGLDHRGLVVVSERQRNF